VFIDGTIEWYPYPTVAQNGTFRFRRLGGYMGSIRYSDDVWTGHGSWGAEADYLTTISATAHFRERFRVTRANRTVNGVYMRVLRWNNTTGNLIVKLESGPASDTSGNGTQIEQVTVSSSVLCNVGAADNYNEVDTGGGGVDFSHFIWVPFSQNRTLQAGTIYNLRLHTTGGLDARIAPTGRADGTPGFGVNGPSSSWDAWEAWRAVEWTAWEDSRGAMRSTNSGTSWQFLSAVTGARLSPILFKCL
jgi:hypothetical protein